MIFMFITYRIDHWKVAKHLFNLDIIRLFDCHQWPGQGQEQFIVSGVSVNTVDKSEHDPKLWHQKVGIFLTLLSRYLKWKWSCWKTLKKSRTKMNGKSFWFLYLKILNVILYYNLYINKHVHDETHCYYFYSLFYWDFILC